MSQLSEFGPFDYHYRYDHWAVGGHGDLLTLCNDVLGEWFEVDTSRPLWLRVHATSGRDRVKVEAISHDCYSVNLRSREEGIVPTYMSNVLVKAVLRLLGGADVLPVYVSVVQEEGE